MILINQKEFLIKAISDEVNRRKSKKEDIAPQIKYILNLISECEMIDEVDYYDTFSKEHIPKVNIFTDLDTDNYTVLNKPAIILMYINQDDYLPKFYEIIEKLAGDYSYDIVVGVQYIPDTVQSYIRIIY